MSLVLAQMWECELAAHQGQLPHLRQDWARPLPHLRRDWARPFDICGLTVAPCGATAAEHWPHDPEGECIGRVIYIYIHDTYVHTYMHACIHAHTHTHTHTICVSVSVCIHRARGEGVRRAAARCRLLASIGAVAFIAARSCAACATFAPGAGPSAIRQVSSYLHPETTEKVLKVIEQELLNHHHKELLYKEQ